jgi:ADP-ribose pyrophosphatase YjhB (NUDIX family)
VSADPAIKVRVAGVYTRGDEILLVNHVKDGRSYWLLPGGGLEFGESLAACLERELREEAGVETRTGALLLVAESLPPDGHRHVLNLVFKGELVRGEARLNEQSERLKGVAWRKRSELADLAFYPDIKGALLEHWAADFSLPAKSLGDLWKD